MPGQRHIRREQPLFSDRVTNAATGAFTAVDGTGTITGTLNFMTGSGSGSYNDPSGSPTTGSFVIFRR